MLNTNTMSLGPVKVLQLNIQGCNHADVISSKLTLPAIWSM